MKKPKSSPPCSACSLPCPDMARRFDPVLRWVCPECHAFLLFADKALRKVGIEGTISEPDRHVTNPEPETP